MNKLEEKFMVQVIAYKSGHNTIEKVKKELDSLTKDVAVKFAEWSKSHASELDYREQITHTEEQLFDYFKENIYKP